MNDIENHINFNKYEFTLDYVNKLLTKVDLLIDNNKSFNDLDKFIFYRSN